MLTQRSTPRYASGVKSSRNEVAELLRDLRQSKGESLRAAAKGIGVDPGHLARVEAGEKPLSNSLSERVTAHYDVRPDELHLAAGRVPPDVVAILIDHPEELDRLRKRYEHHG